VIYPRATKIDVGDIDHSDAWNSGVAGHAQSVVDDDIPTYWEPYEAHARHHLAASHSAAPSPGRRFKRCYRQAGAGGLTILTRLPRGVGFRRRAQAEIVSSTAPCRAVDDWLFQREHPVHQCVRRRWLRNGLLRLAAWCCARGAAHSGTAAGEDRKHQDRICQDGWIANASNPTIELRAEPERKRPGCKQSSAISRMPEDQPTRPASVETSRHGVNSHYRYRFGQPKTAVGPSPLWERGEVRRCSHHRTNSVDAGGPPAAGRVGGEPTSGAPQQRPMPRFRRKVAMAISAMPASEPRTLHRRDRQHDDLLVRRIR